MPAPWCAVVAKQALCLYLIHNQRLAMDEFNYRQDQLMAEQVPCANIAKQWQTPSFVYSYHTLNRHWHAFSDPLQKRNHLLCFAVKSNPNVAILQQFARWGAGFDVVSIGELERALTAGAKANTIVFSGVGKQRFEQQRALEVGIKCFNIESVSELHQLNDIAQQMSLKAPIALRVNPNIDPKTHPYISTGLQESKFGVPIEQALEIYQLADQLPNIAIKGIACHIGSQITSLEPFIAAAKALSATIAQLQQAGITLSHCDLGGGLGVRYKDETPPLPKDYIEAICAHINPAIELILEPGRCIAANAGILLTQIITIKTQGQTHFAIVDAAMNDLMRPALYQAWHDVVPVQPRKGPTKRYDIVGPICESGDFIAKGRDLNLEEGDLLAIRTAGAYAFSMSSQYNSRPRAAELMVKDDTIYPIRQRERIQSLYANEQLLP